MSFSPVAERDEFLDVEVFASGFEQWLDEHPDVLSAVSIPLPDYDERVEAMRAFMAALFTAGWARYGWSRDVGGLGGTIAHRAAMWEVAARKGVAGMALFEHLEILAPTLAHYAPKDFLSDALPAFLSGRDLWAQGFSEPDAGSDLANLRTTAVRRGDRYVINGRKVWTSWAKYARWCLLLARTGEPGSAHRGLSAFIIELDQPGVEVRAIQQANGTDELAEVFLDDVEVSAARMVGDEGAGWAVAMHILSNERGTFAWFRHCFLYQQLLETAHAATGRDDTALGEALLDLAAVSSAGHAGVLAHSNGEPLGVKAAYTKLLLCAAEQSVNDRVLANDTDLAAGHQDPDVAMRRQEYLFSRIVTVYGGSQQMQLETIAKQILRLP